MKKRLALVLISAMLLTGCGDEEQSVSETSEQTTEQTTVSTTAASIEYPEYPEFVGTDGETLKNDVEELKAFFSGADEYCYYSEFGGNTSYHSGFLQNAMELSAANEDFDHGFDSRDFDGCKGIEDGSFYFGVSTTYRHPAEYTTDDPYIMHDHETGITYNQDTYTYRYDYFCLNSDTGVLEQISLPEGFDRIETMGRDFMLCHGENGYAVVERLTDEIYEIDCGTLMGKFYVGDDLYITTSEILPDESDAVYSVHWITIEDGKLYNRELIAPSANFPDVRRGVYNFVYKKYDSQRYDFSVFALNGSEYLDFEPHGRVRDFVRETYYPCSAVAVANKLGYTTYLTLTDRSEKEHILGSIFTEEKPDFTYSPSFDIHATKDGLVYLNVDGFRPIMLKWDEETDRVSAAFIYDYYIPEHSTVMCDGERLYFYAKQDGDLVLTTITAADR